MNIICTLPNDSLKEISSFLPARDLVSLRATCKVASELCEAMIREFTELEQRRMGITFSSVPLNLKQIARIWSQLPPEQCREIRKTLCKSPLVFYTMLRPAERLLQEDILAARNPFDMTAMASIVGKKNDIRIVEILGHLIADESRITDIALKDKTLLSLAFCPELPSEAVLKFAKNITDYHQRDRIFLHRILTDFGLPIEIALEMAHSIMNKSFKEKALQNLALRAKSAAV